jgi:hypothetical protein
MQGAAASIDPSGVEAKADSAHPIFTSLIQINAVADTFFTV